MRTRMLLSEVRPTLYKYGRELALSDYEVYVRNAKQVYPYWKYSDEIARLARQKLEEFAYDLMHCLLCYDTESIGVQACIDGYRSVANYGGLLSGK